MEAAIAKKLLAGSSGISCWYGRKEEFG